MPAIVWLKEVSGRGGSRTLDSDHRYTRVYQVLTDANLDGPGWLLDQPQIWQVGQTYVETDANDVVQFSDPESAVAEVRAEQSNADQFNDWRVTVEFVGKNDPVMEPAEVEWEEVEYQRAMLKDLDGVAVVNAAKDPFDGGVIVDRGRWAVTIVKNVLTWDPVDAAKYRRSTNAQPFLATSHPPGFPVGTGKMRSIGASRVRRSNNESFYWRRRVVVDLNLGDPENPTNDPPGWLLRERDAGFHELRTVGGIQRKYKIVFADGTTPGSPVPLAEDGTALALGADPREVTFRGYKSVDWTPLNLDY